VRIHIVCDLEGTAGVVDARLQCSFDLEKEWFGPYYVQARRLATLELNAAVQSALDGAPRKSGPGTDTARSLAAWTSSSFISRAGGDGRRGPSRVQRSRSADSERCDDVRQGRKDALRFARWTGADAQPESSCSESRNP